MEVHLDHTLRNDIQCIKVGIENKIGIDIILAFQIGKDSLKSVFDFKKSKALPQMTYNLIIT